MMKDQDRAGVPRAPRRWSCQLRPSRRSREARDCPSQHVLGNNPLADSWRMPEQRDDRQWQAQATTLTPSSRTGAAAIVGYSDSRAPQRI
jgi:hypothetical protein